MKFLLKAVALAVLFVSSTQAFVPRSTTFNLLQGRSIGSSKVDNATFKVQAFAASAMSSTSQPRGGASLNMGNILVDMHNMFVLAARPDLLLTDILIKKAKATMQEAQTKSTDEYKINAALQELQNDLIKIQEAYGASVDAQRRILSQLRQADAAANGWYRRAEEALRRGYSDGMVKNALAERQAHLRTAKGLQERLDVQTAATQRLAEGVRTVDNQFRRAHTKRGELLTRAKTAESVKRVNDMLRGLTQTAKLTPALERMEQTVQALEAAAEVSTEGTVFADAVAPLSRENSLEMDFLELKASAAGQDEYKRLKDAESRRRIETKTDEEITRDLKELERELMLSGRF